MNRKMIWGKMIWGKKFWFDLILNVSFIGMVLYSVSTFLARAPFGESVVFAATFSLVMSFIVVLVTYWFGIETLGTKIFNGSQPSPSRPFLQSFWGWELTILTILMILVGARVTNLSIIELFDENGFAGAQRIFGALLTPNWAIFRVAIIAIVETIFIAFMATFLSVPMAFVLAFFAARNITNDHFFLKLGYYVLRTALNVTRSIEPLIWAIIFSVWVGIGPFAGMLALMFHSISSLTKQYSEIIECVEEGPIEGVKSTGANEIQTIWFAIVPQIVLPYISFTIYRWDINVRMATIIGLVGGGGIGTLLIQYQGQGLWHEVGTLAFLIIIVVWVMDMLSAQLRDALK